MAPVQSKETTATDLGSLLDAGDGAVVMLVAGDTRLAVHRAVLGRSPVFAAMFGHDTLEAGSGEVSIPDVGGVVLRQLLAFLYTLRAPQLPDLASDVLVAADKYGVSALKAACEQQVAAQLSVETAAATAVLAVRHSCESLRKTAIDFVRANVLQVITTQGWADAIHMQPGDVVEVSRLVGDPQTETSRPDSGTSTPASAAPQPQSGDCNGHSKAPASAAATTASRHDDDVSRLRPIQQTKEATATDLGSLLDAGDGAMVTLVAGDMRLVAHRAILVERSPVFAAMFGHDTLEAGSGEVSIPDVGGAVLRQLLAFLYTQQVPQLSDMASPLLVAADKYGVSALKAACEQQVAAQLSVETAAAAAVLAVRHSCESLRKTAINFVRANVLQVMTTQGWADAIHMQPGDVVEVSRLVGDPLAETSKPTPAESGTSTAASRHTPPPDDDAISRLRNIPDEEKGRRLIAAAKQGAVGELEALLAAGANVAATDWERKTALHWAAHEGHVEAARRLITRGAPLEVRNKWQSTPLHSAAVWGHAAVMRLLLAASARHSARQSQGCTPLHLAASYGNAEAAAALLEGGANRWARDKDGNTPLDLARRGNRQQLVNLLTTG